MNKSGMRMETYWSPDHFKQEIDAILDQRWVVLGRSDTIPTSGYRTFNIGRHRIAVTRDDDSQLFAFSRICLHRWMELCEGTRKTSKIVCPYHGWRFDLRGKLEATPQMTPSLQSNTLQPYAVAERYGLLFLTMNAPLDRLEKLLQSLQRTVLSNEQLANYVQLGTANFGSFQFNWKIALENGECNHHDYVHQNSLGTEFPARMSAGHALGRDCFGQINFSVNTTTDFGAIKTLFGIPPDRYRDDYILLIFIFPFTFIYISNSLNLIYNMVPTTANETAVYCDFFGNPAESINEKERRRFVETLVQEDTIVCGKIQNMVNGNFGDQAIISPEEPMNIAFRQWYLTLAF